MKLLCINETKSHNQTTAFRAKRKGHRLMFSRDDTIVQRNWPKNLIKTLKKNGGLKQEKNKLNKRKH